MINKAFMKTRHAMAAIMKIGEQNLFLLRAQINIVRKIL